MILIKKMVPEDYETISKLAILVNIFTVAEMETSKELFEKCFKAETEDSYQCLVAESESEIVGFVFYQEELLANKVWELVMFAVHPEHQNKKIGSLLIENLEKSLSDTHQNMVILKTSALPQYVQACNFYKKHGYKQEAKIENYWGEGDDMLLFSKKLLPST